MLPIILSTKAGSKPWAIFFKRGVEPIHWRWRRRRRHRRRPRWRRRRWRRRPCRPTWIHMYMCVYICMYMYMSACGRVRAHACRHLHLCAVGPDRTSKTRRSNDAGWSPTNALLVRRWQKSCTGWHHEFQSPSTPRLILILDVARILGGGQDEVVQDFCPWSECPNTYSARLQY